jgi:hypothetical protein
MGLVLKNKKVVAALAGLAVVAAVMAFWMLREGGGPPMIDLISLLPEAEKVSHWKEPGDAPFTVKEVALAGESHKAVFAPAFSRIRWKVQVPRRGILQVYYGLRDDAWTGDGDGVVFSVGVSDGRTFEEYVRETVSPRDRERDRRWLSATIDLASYEGQVVELNFNTYSGPRGHDTDKRNDLSLWGDPRVVGQ